MRSFKYIIKENFLTKQGKVQANVRNALPYLRQITLPKGSVHPYTWHKSKGHYMLGGQSDTTNVITFLRAFDIKLVFGNDAPRGGAVGEYYHLSNSKDKKKLKKILEVLNTF